MKTVQDLLNTACSSLADKGDEYTCNPFYSQDMPAGPCAIIYLMQANPEQAEMAVEFLNAEYSDAKFHLEDGLGVISVWLPEGSPLLTSRIEDFVDRAYYLCEQSRVAVEVFKSTTTHSYFVEFLDINKEDEADLILQMSINQEFPVMSSEYDENNRTLQVWLNFA